jgi:hypothetical protein
LEQLEQLEFVLGKEQVMINANEIQYELPGVIDPKLENWRIEITIDRFCDNPRNDCDCLIGKFFVKNSCKYVENELTEIGDFSDWSSGNYQTDKKRLEEMGFIVYPVSVYDHSGWNMFIGKSTGWDCGCIGFYLVKKAHIYREFKKHRISVKFKKKIDYWVKTEVKQYSDWANCECWEYHLFRNDEEEDNLSGFIDSDFDKAFEAMYNNFPDDFCKAFSVEEAKKFIKMI